MSSFTVLGDGTLTLGSGPTAFEGEVLGVQVTHDYDEGDSRTMLDGTVRAATTSRTDGLEISIESDLTAAGMYKFLFDNDGQDQPFEFVPNTTDGATWAGTVSCRLPGSIGSDEYGSPIVADVTLPGVGKFTFTAAP